MHTLMLHRDVCVCCCAKITSCEGRYVVSVFSFEAFQLLTHFRTDTSHVSLQQDGNAAFSRGDFNRAMEHYSKCLELDPSMITAHGNRAIAALKSGRPKDALADCNAVIAHDPSNIKAWLRRGQACFDLDQHAEAKAAWEQALQVQPGNKQALFGLQLCKVSHS
jgi:tetratricopeptide (TPR) repeat protein